MRDSFLGICTTDNFLLFLYVAQTLKSRVEYDKAIPQCRCKNKISEDWSNQALLYRKPQFVAFYAKMRMIFLHVDGEM